MKSFCPKHDWSIKNRLQVFIDCFNKSHTNYILNPLLRAGITHLWFIMLHPFDDGNVRITRTLTDLALALMAEKASVYMLYRLLFLISAKFTMTF